MKITLTINIDDAELRQLLASLVPAAPPGPPANPNQLLTADDVAERLQISTRTVGRLIRAGDIRTVSVGAHPRITQQALADYIASKAESQVPALLSAPARQLPRMPRRSASPPPQPAPSPTGRITMRPASPAIPQDPKTINWGPQPRDSWPATLPEHEAFLAKLPESGWPDDLIEDMRQDFAQGQKRFYIMGMNEAATYLGVTQKDIRSLIKDGKLRELVLGRESDHHKPRHCVPAKEVLALAAS